ncbi:MAG: antibiotic biosynthesis monooxygenase [Acidimicrobiia bacterium]|nr:antibiotic biosynthesis monooxygenase [Acidimicrobiia bacterium]
MYVRFFYSAVDPDDADEIRRIFSEDVRPAFQAAPGCLSVELLVDTEPNAGGLLEGVVVSRWRSPADVDAALESRAVADSMVRIRQLLRLEPIVRTFEAVDE